MFKRSTSRNQRPKSIKGKQVLQILLLLGICFWLIYQVKYSHDKKREINEERAISSKERDSDVLKIGRKDLHPRNWKHKEEDDEQEKNGEDEEEEQEERSKSEEEELEERNKPRVEEGEEENPFGGKQLEDMKEHEERESEEDEKGHREEEGEEEVKRGELEGQEKPRETEEGQEEEEIKIDESDDQEKLQDEGDREEEFIDEEKEKEEESDEKENEGNDEEDKDGQIEDENNVNMEDETGNTANIEDEEHDELNRGTHEAREEHYRGDDASSAVAHDTHLSTMEIQELDVDTNGLDNSNTTNKYNEDGKNSEPESGATSNGTDGIGTIHLDDSLLQNLTVSSESNGLRDVNINSTEASALHFSNSSSTNETQVMLDLPHEVENATENKSATILRENEEFSVMATTNAELGETSNSGNKSGSISENSSNSKEEADDSLRLTLNMTESNGTSSTQNQESDGLNEAGEVQAE